MEGGEGRGGEGREEYAICKGGGALVQCTIRAANEYSSGWRLGMERVVAPDHQPSRSSRDSESKLVTGFNGGYLCPCVEVVPQQLSTVLTGRCIFTEG